MLRDMDEIKQEAEELGLEFSDRIGAGKLQERIDEFYELEGKEDTEEVEPVKNIKSIIGNLEKINKKLFVVKLTMVDKREASTATSARFSNGNIQMEVPLDVFVEMPYILIAQAEKAEAMISKLVNGTSVSSMAKKYVIEYKR